MKNKKNENINKNLKKKFGDINEDKNILNLKIIPFLISQYGFFLVIIFFSILFFFIPQYHSPKYLNQNQ